MNLSWLTLVCPETVIDKTTHVGCKLYYFVVVVAQQLLMFCKVLFCVLNDGAFMIIEIIYGY